MFTSIYLRNYYVMSEEKYCKVAKKCSGCQLSNMDYARQLKFKQNEIRLRYSRLCKSEKIIGCASPLHYRNKAQFMFKKLKGRIVCGIYQSADRTVVPTNSCQLHTDNQNKAGKILSELFESFKLEPYDFHKGKGLIKSAIVRESLHTGELMVVLVCDSRRPFPCPTPFADALSKKLPNLSSLILTKHRGNTLTPGETPKVIFGKETITDKLCGMEFIISYNSFFQINSLQTERLYTTAVDFATLTPRDTVLDAYSGTGTIGMICAPHCKKVYSVELNKNAVKDAIKNAKHNNISNIESVCADSEEYIKELTEMGTPLSCAVLDPPRAGCSKSFLASLASLAPERIVYISCNIDTQIRDVRFLLKQGYKLEKVQGVDMFPYTKHIECVVRLTRSILNESPPEAKANNPMPGQIVNVIVDRPMGSQHPSHPDIIYPVNYGYIPGIMAPDGEEQDAYILGINKPIKNFTGHVIAIIRRYDDTEDKWVVAPEGTTFTKEEIMDIVSFQEQYFYTEIIM